MTGYAMTEDKRKVQLLKLFSTISGKTKIVEPMKNIHGTLRDSDAIEREVALVMREITEQGIFKTSLKPIQLAKLVTLFYAGKNDTEIARQLGDEKTQQDRRTCTRKAQALPWASISRCLLIRCRWKN